MRRVFDPAGFLRQCLLPILAAGILAGTALETALTAADDHPGKAIYQKPCASCHGDAESMAGVRTQMPHVNEDGELWAMEDYVNNCRTERMGAEAWGWESGPMLAMTTMISDQSRGLQMNVEIDGEALTPAESSGLLPGTLRAELLANRRIREAVVTLDDLERADRIWTINSLRGWTPATVMTAVAGV